MTGSPPRATPPPRRSWLEIRWRQFRNAPRPVVRAVMSNLVVASVLGAFYLAYDVALTRGVPLPGGDLRFLFGTLDVVIVLVVGTVVTWLIVPAPGGTPGRGSAPLGPGSAPLGPGARRTRTGWSAALGFFASVPVAYLVLVFAIQVLKPLLT